MRVVLVHVRDPQFYAIPRKKTPKSGRLQVMGFPPIGIMSLCSVLKRAGHECFIFDQANPATPNEVIVSEIRRIKPHLVGLSFLSTTSYPYAKILARAGPGRRFPRQDRLRRRLCVAERTARQATGSRG